MSSLSQREPASAPRPRRRVRLRIPDETGVLVALVALVGGIGIFRPRFVEVDNLLSLVASSAFFGMIALAMVFLLALGEIDLSVGWNFNFSAVIAGTAMVHGVDPWLAALLGILFGAGLGLVNGILAVGLRLPIIIVTLGTFSAFRGLALVVDSSSPVTPPDITGRFFSIFSDKLLGVPVIAIVFVTLALVLHLVLHHTRFGYRVQAIGSNPEAARLAGIPIARTKVLVLMLVGAVCGLSGVTYLAFFNAVDPSSGQDFMLTVIAAAIIGGTPLSGGWGTTLGALLGVGIIATISSGIAFFGIDATWSTFVTGAVIILAVAIDQLVRWQSRRRLEGAAG